MTKGVLVAVFCGVVASAGFGATIIDHTCTDLTQVPQTALQAAKDDLVIAYGHTSHGSQLTTGMTGLVGFINGGGLGLSYPADFLAYNSSGTGGALQLRDTPFSGASDLGAPDRVTWASATRTYLAAHPEVNVIIWSWCGQVSTATAADIETYLGLMNQLEIDYPGVQFVYMTGHLDGGGSTGNLNVRNQQIRDYCITNDKILYDFADIESYDPDGLLNYMALACNDNCDYDSDGNGSRDRNWALAWQGAHTVNVEWYECTSAHSQSLNANRKAYAAWWLWARLAGWDPVPCAMAPSGLTADYNDLTQEVILHWTDNSSSPEEDSFIIQRQVNGEAWNDLYASVGNDVTTFSETLSANGTYLYRVAAHLNDNGSGAPCTSSPSNAATIVISDDGPPAGPSDLQCSLVGGNDVQLGWTDNSDNEQAFVVERAVDGGEFAVVNDTLLPDTESWTDTDVATQHTYSYRVKARNGDGDSEYSNTVSQNVPYMTYTIRLQSTGEVDDSFIWASNPNTNYGTSSWAAATMDINHRFVIKFNFPSILTGKRILDAKVYFYGWQQSGYTEGLYMQLYRLMREWTETGTTWNNAATGVAWTAPGGDYNKQIAEVHVTAVDHQYYPPADLTDAVRRWVRAEVPNYGMVLINANATFRTNLKTSEYSSGHTYLDITYTDTCPCDIAADFDYNCTVNLVDLATMGQYWGLLRDDLDIAPAGGDGIVDFNDMGRFAEQWLTSCQ